MKWNAPVHPPAHEKILRDHRGNIDEDCPKRLEAQPSMTAEQHAFIQIVCAMKANPCYCAMTPNQIVQEAILVLEQMVNETGD